MTKTDNKAFSLIELLVSISIVTMITTIVMFGYTNFNDTLGVTSAAQEIAVAIRQAQTYGLDVRETKVGAGLFSFAYGIYFDPTNSPSDYYIFVDTNSNKKYDVGSGCGSGATECIERMTLRNNVRVSSICDSVSCPPSVTTKKLDVTFLRPNTDANVYFTDNTGVIVSGPVSLGRVKLISPKGKIVTITVESTGQISVQ